VVALLRLLWLVLLLLLSSLLLLCIDSSLPAGLESSLQCSWVGVLLLINWGVLRSRLPFLLLCPCPVTPCLLLLLQAASASGRKVCRHIIHC
jgi:hypothetical protein